MYRKIHSVEEQVPLRYLLVDPQARHHQARALQLDLKLLSHLETIILPNNHHMRTIKRLAKLRGPSADASIVLEWSEGVDEVAGIVDMDPSADRSCRRVFIGVKS